MISGPPQFSSHGPAERAIRIILDSRCSLQSCEMTQILHAYPKSAIAKSLIY